MMKCPKCQSLVEDDATSCWNCFVTFKAPDPDAPLGNPRPGTYVSGPRRRPDGSALLGLGTGLLVLAAILFLLSMSGGSSSSYESGSSLFGQAMMAFVAAGFFQLGLVLTLAGTIVRAIWFLPGDEEKMPPAG